MLEPAFTGVFPAFHMELVKVPIPSWRNLGAQGRLSKEKGCKPTFSMRTAFFQTGYVREGVGGVAVLSGYKNIEFGPGQNAL